MFVGRTMSIGLQFVIRSQGDRRPKVTTGSNVCIWCAIEQARARERAHVWSESTSCVVSHNGIACRLWHKFNFRPILTRSRNHIEVSKRPPPTVLYSDANATSTAMLPPPPPQPPPPPPPNNVSPSPSPTQQQLQQQTSENVKCGCHGMLTGSI